MAPTVPTQTRVLAVEDDPAFALLLAARLGSVAPSINLQRVPRLADALRRAHTESYDAILLDLNLPDSAGLPTFTRLHESVPDVAVVVLTGCEDTQMAAEAVRLGAQDYLLKDAEPAALLHALQYAVRRQRHLSELAAATRAELAAKNRFLSHVSHELRTPLAVIHQYASLLVDRVVTDPAEVHELLEVVLHDAEHLHRMVDDLLDVSRLQETQVRIVRQPMDLEALVRSCLDDLRVSARRLNVVYLPPQEPLPTVWADRNRVKQVVINVLSNAVKFTPDGGRITMQTRLLRDGVCVTITDDGPGVAPENIERIFERFFQESPDVDTGRVGLGLGLFVSRQLMERQNGRLWAESSPGQGCRFHIMLPTRAAAALKE